MKTNDLKGLLLLMAVVSACTATEQEQIINDDLPFAKEQKTVIISATVESQPETRTTLADDFKTVLWKPADEIKVFSAGEASKFISQNNENQKAVNFLGTISVITGTAEGTGIDTHIYGLYPYMEEATMTDGSFTATLPSVQTGVANSFDDDLFISIGRSYTFSMGFWNVCSGYRISFTEDGYQSVTLTSNDGTPLAGTFVATFGDDGKPIITSNPTPSTSVTVNAPEGGFVKNTWYYLIVLPGTHASGFTFTATNGSGTGSYVISDEREFPRSSFRQISGLDQRLTFPEIEDYVDLGLSVLWATRNVGADTPEALGELYAWGEVEPKDTYSWDNYKWCLGGRSTITKYCVLNGDGFPDGRTRLLAEDDAASYVLGGDWRTPTADECAELIDFCSWEWDAERNGYVITSNVEGFTDKSIFLPKDEVAYWSADCMSSGCSAAYLLDYPIVTGLPSSSRCYGRHIRPVQNPEVERTIPVQRITITPSCQILQNAYKGITVTFWPSYATNKSVTWTSSDETIATISESGYTQIHAGNKGGFATITATTVDGQHSATCKVSVIEPVDLGLSVKWANMNLGQTSLAESGNRYAWGEVQTKTSYSWSNYAYGSNWNSITKYNSDSDFGPVDNKHQLERVDDAAYMTLFGYWRMPTWTEIEELAENTTWTATSLTIEGKTIQGITLQSTKSGYTDKTIFIESNSSFWSSVSYPDYDFAPSGYAWSFSISTNWGINCGYDYRFTERCNGLKIRPVWSY